MSSNNFDKDKDFQLLHEKYQAEATELPDKSIDTNILQAAHRAVQAQAGLENKINSNVIKRIKKHPWYRPMSYVAIMVISLSVVMKLAFDPEFAGPGFNGDDFAEEAQTPEAEMMTTKPLTSMPEEQRSSVKLITEKSQQQAVVSELKAKAKKRLMSPEAGSSPTVSASRQSELRLESAAKGAALSEPASPMQRAMSDNATDMFLQESEQDVLVKEVISQKNQIKKLMELHENKQNEKLKIALRQYRKLYPLIDGVDNALPKVLRDLEIKWVIERKKENVSKTP